MSRALFPGPQPPDEIILQPQGQAVSGLSVGIIVIDIWYPLVPGNVANASTFNFPVMFKVLKGASITQIMSGDQALLGMIIEAGEELIRHGARCIVGACGSFAYFQKEAAAAFSVPTYLSSMLQVPLILQSLRPDQKLGIIAASPASLTQKVFDQCHITDPSRLAVTGAKGLPEFDNILQCTGRLNSRKLENELVELARRFVSENPEIGSILLQCSDLPPYAWAVQDAVGLPVYDMVTLINWVQSAAVRRPFVGFM